MSYCLTANLRARPGEEERVAKGLRLNEAESRKEPGVIEWIAFQSANDPRDFFLYEIYRTEADLDAHRATPHFERYGAEVVPLLEVRDVSAWQPLTP